MLKKKFKIAIAEDDEYYNRVLTKAIHDICDSEQYGMFDCEIKSYLSGQKCADHLDSDTNLLILDHYLDNGAQSFFNAFDVMKAVNEKCKGCKVIVMSGQRSKDVAEKLLMKGASLYIDKETEGTQRLREEVMKILDGLAPPSLEIIRTDFRRKVESQPRPFSGQSESPSENGTDISGS